MSTQSKEKFYSQGTQFLKHLREQLQNANVDLKPHWWVDHICYRTSTIENYLDLTNQLTQFGNLLIESEVNGRPISTFKLDSPLFFNDEPIDIIEIPAPKISKPTAEGFEHAEIVCDEPFERLIANYNYLSCDKSGLSKIFNKELEFILDRLTNIKFHQLSLESVINLERNSHIFKALIESKVLEILKEFEPLVAGTFPLNIQIDNSDLDIILNLSNKERFLNTINSFRDYQDFKIQEELVEGTPTILINFNFNGIPFELFAQAKPSVEQRGYKHFLIEEKLLKIYGSKLKNQVTSLRNQGFKTEPAFAKALGLFGDPFVELLNIQKLSRTELLNEFEDKFPVNSSLTLL